MAGKVTVIDEYLAALSADKRAALEKLRKTIRAAAPKAEECISYQIPAFRLDGKVLVSFGAGANHCAFYPSSATTVAAHQDELKNYDTSKGTIRFSADKPLPAVLVRKLVKARIAENKQRSEKAKTPKIAAKLPAANPKSGSSRTDPAVDAFMRQLKHPLKRELEKLRQFFLGISPKVHEEFKWNSPSFRTTDHFATINVHGKDSLRLILHTGAKKKANAIHGLQIADPTGLLKWLAKDRCLVMFDSAQDLEAKRATLRAIVREWIKQV